MTKLFSIFTALADWLTYSLLGMEKGKHLSESIHFFIEDTSKIFVLLVVLIYLIGLARATMDIETVRKHLQGKNRFYGYALGAGFGAITPFCSCSSIPLFLGFTSAGIPIGITMSFLITSPIVNEVAIFLLGSILGVPFTAVYVTVGILAGIIGGIFFDLIKAEKHLTDLTRKSLEAAANSADRQNTSDTKKQQTWKKRHHFAKTEVTEIVGRIWKWVFIGIGVGALFHGFVPKEWVQNNLGKGAWWTVPAASVLGIPLYSNATGIIPVAKSMLAKGIPAGTTLTFMMSVVGASFPEFIMLKQVMKPRLLIFFFLFLPVVFTITGWILNIAAPLLGVQ